MYALVYPVNNPVKESRNPGRNPGHPSRALEIATSPTKPWTPIARARNRDLADADHRIEKHDVLAHAAGKGHGRDVIAAGMAPGTNNVDTHLSEDISAGAASASNRATVAAAVQ